MRQFHKLPKAQDEMIAAWVLGGPEAIGRHSTRTVDALMKKGYIDSDGPTKKALNYVEARHREVVGFNPVVKDRVSKTVAHMLKLHGHKAVEMADLNASSAAGEGRHEAAAFWRSVYKVLKSRKRKTNPGTRPKYTYKDFVTGKLRWTRGKFLGWFPGDFAGVEIKYAGFALGTTGLFIPEYSLTPETRAMLPKG